MKLLGRAEEILEISRTNRKWSGTQVGTFAQIRAARANQSFALQKQKRARTATEAPLFLLLFLLFIKFR